VSPTKGSVRLGGIDMSLRPTRAGRSLIGYMPQEVELFGDTVAANISRFSPCSELDIVRAARMAGAHELIMQLPNGYMTPIGEAGSALSGGMRQRIALARAVFGAPALVVLDEPSSNLDTAGDAALAGCIRELQRQGTTVILVSHRKTTTAMMDKFLVVIDGRLQAFGCRSEVVQHLSQMPLVPMSAAPPIDRQRIMRSRIGS
jgi:ATP-binding cassette subfamily C protein/ATP-binding cassette subfamily C exporter for protease/lipase/ATP-binding cassette subfamily C protein EexD